MNRIRINTEVRQKTKNPEQDVACCHRNCDIKRESMSEILYHFQIMNIILEYGSLHRHINF